MYLRHWGRQVLVLYSYRDCLGRVRQRCAGRFRDRRCVEQRWAAMAEAYPRWSQQLVQLRDKALEILDRIPPRRRGREEKAERQARTLLRLLSQGEVRGPALEALRERLCSTRRVCATRRRRGEAALRRKAVRTRAQLTPTRTRFDGSEAGVEGHRLALEALADFLQREGFCDDGIAVLQERARFCSDREGVSRYAAALSAAGRCQESFRALEDLPLGDAWSQLNRAAVMLSQGYSFSALKYLMRGLARVPGVLPALELLEKGRQPYGDGEYWRLFGWLWDAPGRAFLLRLWKQMLIRVRSSRIKPGARKLVNDRCLGWLLERVELEPSL